VAALVPVSIWDIPEQGARGPKGRHDRTAVAAAAIRLADAGGLEAVTMRAVAAELGIAPMSLYNYVPTKDHLIQLMTDMIGGEYRYPDPGIPDTRAAIADLARQGRAITRRHPWLPDAIRRPAVIGPNGLRYIEYFLGLLSGSGLDTTAKLEFVGLINGFAIMYGGMEATLARQQASTGVSPDQHQAAQVAAMVSAAASGQYPNLAAALAASEPSRVRDGDEVYDSVVQRLIDGALAVGARGAFGFVLPWPAQPG
jgi:AcrR family transcriptional regulator